MVEEDRNSL